MDDSTPPWEALPIPKPGKSGNDSVDDMHRAIGTAVAAWAELEDVLGRLFYEFIGVDHGALAATRAFGVVEAFYTQRKMIKAAADIFFATHEEMGIVLVGKKIAYASILNEFLNRCEKLGTIRNNIIHGRVYFDNTKGQYIVAPQMHDTRYRIDREPDFIYSFADIDEFAKAFRSIPRFIGMMALNVRQAHASSREKYPEEPSQGT